MLLPTFEAKYVFLKITHKVHFEGSLHLNNASDCRFQHVQNTFLHVFITKKEAQGDVPQASFIL